MKTNLMATVLATVLLAASGARAETKSVVMSYTSEMKMGAFSVCRYEATIDVGKLESLRPFQAFYRSWKEADYIPVMSLHLSDATGGGLSLTISTETAAPTCPDKINAFVIR